MDTTNRHVLSSGLLNGFFKGLGAPAFMFDRSPMPPIPEVMIEPPSASAEEALMGDWRKIGQDMVKVISSHAQTTEAAGE